MMRKSPLSLNTMALEENRFHEKILRDMEAELVNHIEAAEILNYMGDKVSKSDREQIALARKYDGPMAAANKLLPALLRAYPDAFIKFVEAVFQTTPGAAGWQLAKKMYDLVPEEFRCGRYKFSESFVQALKEKSSSDDLAESKEQAADSSTMNELSYPGVGGDSPYSNRPSHRASEPCLNQAEHTSPNISRSQSMVLDSSLEDNTVAGGCRMLKEVRRGTLLNLCKVLNKDKRWANLEICNDLQYLEYKEIEASQSPFEALFDRLVKKNWTTENFVQAVQNLPDIYDTVSKILEYPPGLPTCGDGSSGVLDYKVTNQQMPQMPVRNPDLSLPPPPSFPVNFNICPIPQRAQMAPACHITARVEPEAQRNQQAAQFAQSRSCQLPVQTTQAPFAALPSHQSVQRVLSEPSSGVVQPVRSNSQQLAPLQRGQSFQSSSGASADGTHQMNTLSTQPDGTLSSTVCSPSVSVPEGERESPQSGTDQYSFRTTLPESVQVPPAHYAGLSGSTPSLAAERIPEIVDRENMLGASQAEVISEPQSDPFGKFAEKNPCLELAGLREDISAACGSGEDVRPPGPQPAVGDQMNIRAEKNADQEAQRLQEDRRGAELTREDIHGFRNINHGGPPPAAVTINARQDNCILETQSDSIHVSSTDAQCQSGNGSHAAIHSTEEENQNVAREHISSTTATLQDTSTGLVLARQAESLGQATGLASTTDEAIGHQSKLTGRKSVVTGQEFVPQSESQNETTDNVEVSSAQSESRNETMDNAEVSSTQSELQSETSDQESAAQSEHLIQDTGHVSAAEKSQSKTLDSSENISKTPYIYQNKIDLFDSSSGSLPSSQVPEMTAQAPNDDRITESEARHRQNIETVSNSANSGEMNGDDDVVNDDV